MLVHIIVAYHQLSPPFTGKTDFFTKFFILNFQTRGHDSQDRMDEKPVSGFSNILATGDTKYGFKHRDMFFMLGNERVFWARGADAFNYNNVNNKTHSIIIRNLH